MHLHMPVVSSVNKIKAGVNADVRDGSLLKVDLSGESKKKNYCGQ